MKATGRKWAVSEHMTFNGDDFNSFDADAVLLNTLKQGTRLGWEFTNVRPSSSDSFCLYYDSWKPKKVMAAVDDYWGYWLYKVEEAEAAANQ